MEAEGDASLRRGRLSMATVNSEVSGSLAAIWSKYMGRKPPPSRDTPSRVPLIGGAIDREAAASRREALV